MTDTTPDYAGLLERMTSPVSMSMYARQTDMIRALLIERDEAATALRALLERNAELERELEMWRGVKHSSHWKARAEEVEAKLAEAMKVIAALLMCPAIADEDHGDPEWGCEETADAERAGRKFLKENGNGE